MSKVRFEYRERKSKILLKVKRPLIDIEIYSKIDKEWCFIENVLVDTGADLSIIPLF